MILASWRKSTNHQCRHEHSSFLPIRPQTRRRPPRRYGGHLRRALGPILPIVLKRAQLSEITIRKHIDRLVDSLLALGL